ncbi:uncharacterized [Tachysurus ichikawai]
MRTSRLSEIYSFIKASFPQSVHPSLRPLYSRSVTVGEKEVDKRIMTRQSGTEQSRGHVASAFSSLTLMSF